MAKRRVQVQEVRVVREGEGVYAEDLEFVPVAWRWKTNADMLTDAVFPVLRSAGIWDDEMSVFDPTYGDGVWWRRYCPRNLHYRTRRDDPEWDYRDMWDVEDGAFDVVVFDPPYSGKGGRDTSGVKAMDEAYGLVDSPKYARELLTMNQWGLKECLRVARRAVLLKSMQFVESGVLHDHTRELVNLAVGSGWVVYEQFIHLAVDEDEATGKKIGGRPQPQGRSVLRGRGRPSTMTVLVPREMSRGDAGARRARTKRMKEELAAGMAAGAKGEGEG